MACLNHWISACAGMTTEVGFQLVPDGYHSPRPRVPDNEGAFCLLPPFCSSALYFHACFFFNLIRPGQVSQSAGRPNQHPRCHSSESWNPGGQAEEPGSRFLPACARLTQCYPSMSFPLCGNDLSKPLDSSAFVPDTALPPASMQAGLRRNGGGKGFGLCQTVTVFLSRVFQIMTGLSVHCHAFCFVDVFFMSINSLSFQGKHTCHEQAGMRAGHDAPLWPRIRSNS